MHLCFRALIILALVRPGVPQPPRPNVLLITVEDLRPDALGVYREHYSSRRSGAESSTRGSSASLTPHLDLLARSGAAIGGAHATAPSVVASFESLLHGVHPAVHGVLDRDLALAGAFLYHSRPLPRLLASCAGYVTALVGNDPLASSFVPPARPVPPRYGRTIPEQSEAGRRNRSSALSYGALAAHAAEWIAEQQKQQQQAPGGSGVPWFLHLALPGPLDARGGALSGGAVRGAGGDARPLPTDLPAALPAVDWLAGDLARLPPQTLDALGISLGVAPGGAAGRPVPDDPLVLRGAGSAAGSAAGATLERAGVAARRSAYAAAVAELDRALGSVLDLAFPALPSTLRSAPSGLSGATSMPGTLVVFAGLVGSPLHDGGLAGAASLGGPDAPGHSLSVPLVVSWPGVVPPRGLLGGTFGGTLGDLQGSPLVDRPLGGAAQPPSAFLASLVDVPATILRAARCPFAPDAQGLSLLAALTVPPPGAPPGASNGALLGPSTAAVLAAWPRAAVPVAELGGLGLVTRRWRLAYYPHDGQGFLFRRQAAAESSSSGGGGGAVGGRAENLWGVGEAAAAQGSLLLALLKWRGSAAGVGALVGALPPRPAIEGRERAAALARAKAASSSGGDGKGGREVEAVLSGKLNRNGKPRKVRVVDSARTYVEGVRGSAAEEALQRDAGAAA